MVLYAPRVTTDLIINCLKTTKHHCHKIMLWQTLTTPLPSNERQHDPLIKSMRKLYNSADDLIHDLSKNPLENDVVRIELLLTIHQRTNDYLEGIIKDQKIELSTCDFYLMAVKQDPFDF